jgi:HK97 family phage major capsid protein
MEPTIQEVKTALDEAGRIWNNELKDVKAKIAEQETAGKTVGGDLIAQRDKLNKLLEDASEQNEQFMKLQATVQRLEKAGAHQGLDGRDKLEAETKAFNSTLRGESAQAGKSVPAELTVAEYKAYASAFDRYLRVGQKGLTPDETRALSVGTDLNGGYLVTPDKSGAMVKKIFETSDVRRFASVQAISTDALEGSADLDEASGGWVGELGSRSDSTTPTVPQPWKIPVHELYSMPKSSQKLLNDANIDVAAWLAGKVADKLSRLQNTAFVTGTGVGRPRGFASYTTSATYAWGTPEHTATGSNGSFGTDPNAIQKLNAMMGDLKDSYVPGSAFFMTRLTKFAMRNLTDASSAGKFVFIPSFQAGVPDQILGAQIQVFQDMADYTTTDALAVAYGNMARFYQIVDRQGISVLVDPFTAKPYVVFYTTARVGGDVIDFEAMKFLKFGTS